MKVKGLHLVFAGALLMVGAGGLSARAQIGGPPEPLVVTSAPQGGIKTAPLPPSGFARQGGGAAVAPASTGASPLKAAPPADPALQALLPASIKIDTLTIDAIRGKMMATPDELSIAIGRLRDLDLGKELVRQETERMRTLAKGLSGS